MRKDCDVAIGAGAVLHSIRGRRHLPHGSSMHVKQLSVEGTCVLLQRVNGACPKSKACISACEKGRRWRIGLGTPAQDCAGSINCEPSQTCMSLPSLGPPMFRSGGRGKQNLQFCLTGNLSYLTCLVVRLFEWSVTTAPPC